LWGEQPDILNDVRHSICTQEYGIFRYAIVPVVAGAVATTFAATVEEFKAVAGLYQGGWKGSAIKNDVYYWYHYNLYRIGLPSLTRAIRWLFYALKHDPNFELLFDAIDAGWKERESNILNRRTESNDQPCI
jgi:hypothetical protein